VSGTIAILRAAERAAVPWRNGGGVTCEVAAHPLGRGFEALDWRVSIAEIGAAGPFSAFPGLERRLAVLEGRLSLDIGQQPPLEVSPASPAVHFDGDVLVYARPIAGTVTDLNVMTRRGRFTSALTLHEVRAALALAPVATTTLVLALGQLTIRGTAGEWQLSRLDAARCEAGTPFNVVPQAEPARFYMIEMRALDA
jgi:environmental stress-induced protein Ves